MACANMPGIRGKKGQAMQRDDANTNEGVTRPPSDSSELLFFSSPLPQETASTAASVVPHARTRFLTQETATKLVRDVARLLCEEQAAGSFGDEQGDSFDAIVCSKLSGACCIAAALTARTLLDAGYSARIVGGKPPPEFLDPSDPPNRIRHWWVQTSDGWVLDPTWGQYRWCIDPLVVHVNSAESKALTKLATYSLEEFMQWRGHPSLPTEHPLVFARLVARLKEGFRAG